MFNLCLNPLRPPQFCPQIDVYRHFVGDQEGALAETSEFGRLISGERLMVAYCTPMGEQFYYADRDKFESAAKSGSLKKKRFYIKNEKQSFRLVYEIFATPENFWRLQTYRVLKKIGQNCWNEDLEAVERILLGRKICAK